MLSKHTIRNILSTQQHNIEILNKLKKGQISTKQIIKEYKVSKSTVKRIKRNADKIKKIKQQINLIRKRANEVKYEQLQDSSYKCYRKRIKPGDFSKPLFKAKEIEREFGGPSTIDGEKQLLGNLKPFKREKQQESTNYKSRNSSENSQSLVQETNKTEQELDAEKFIRKFNHQLEEENIRRDNIYTMIKISFELKPYFQCTHQVKNKIHVKKLRNDRLVIMFCTNATGSHKLLPFYIYEYEDKEAEQFLKNKEGVVFTSKENTPKNDKIFANWYNNNFMKLVKKHQKKTNASGKVLLLVKKSKTFILPEDAMQNDNFEILFFPFGTSQIFQSLKLLNMRQKIRQKFKIFEHFCTCYDIGLFIGKIHELWANISSAYIESVWKKLLKSDSLIEKNATSLVEQMSKLDKNVTEEDIVSRKSSASRDEKLDFLFSKVVQDCSSVSRKTENTTSTCMVKQKPKLTESELEEHIALKETPTEINEKIQFLFSKLLRFCPPETEIATSTWTVEQTSKLIKNVTGEDTALKETPTEIETEIKEPQQNTEIKLDDFTNRIQQHLKLRNVLRAAVHDVMIDNRSISDVTESYKLNIEILQLKMDILKSRRKYLQRKIKYEAAIKDIIAEKRSKHEAVRHYGICQNTLNREIARRKHLGKKYKFDRKVMCKSNVSVSEVRFTFQQEQLLLKSLEISLNFQDKRMCNSICALKYLSILAYEFVKENNTQYPEDWDEHKRADIVWLREFEMRYSNDIFILLYNCTYKRDSKKKISDKQQLLHLFDKNISNIIFETF